MSACTAVAGLRFAAGRSRWRISGRDGAATRDGWTRDGTLGRLAPRPVDLLLLVGIFGNVGEPDIETTVRAAAAMCRPGASVVWSRHRRAPDATERIRAWFDDIGAREIAFVSEGPNGFAVGEHARR